jgi:hypothetical protein
VDAITHGDTPRSGSASNTVLSHRLFHDCLAEGCAIASSDFEHPYLSELELLSSSNDIFQAFRL